MQRAERLLSLIAIVFGVVAAIASVLILFFARPFASSAAAGLLPGLAEPPIEMMAKLIEAQAEISPYSALLWSTTLVLAAVLVAVGSGLYFERPWARQVSFGWSIAALLLIPFEFWLQLGVIQPRTHAALLRAAAAVHRELASVNPTPHTPVDWTLAVVRHLIIYAPLPIMLLVLAKRAQLAKA